MRLLNIYNLQFSEFSNDNCPPYITTSHRWSNDETTYQNVKDRRHTDSIGFKKLEAFCAIARKDNESLHPSSTYRCDWIWSDTSCIDKTSSAEVTESINSMFTWYKKANHCLAYLADVRPLSSGTDAMMSDFERSEWFRRGWTLQELLAPPCVTFLTRDWEVIGHKCSSRTLAVECAGCCQPSNIVLNRPIANITGVPEDILWNYEESKTLRPKEKWSWTDNRRTTRPEDAAYCLLGIFNVYMPLIYGEGAENASIRLKQEIQNRKRGRLPASQRKPQNEWNVFSSQSSSFPFKNAASFSTAPRKTSSSRSNTASDISDKENTARRQRGANRGPNPVQTRPAEQHRFPDERAVHAGLSPAQIACAGKYLPQLDLEALSRLRPSQIAAARHTLPDWDLNVLAGLSPSQINATVNAGRVKQQPQR